MITKRGMLYRRVGLSKDTIITVTMKLQGCPIGIPKNPDITEADRTENSSRKKFTRPARNAASLESAMGGGGSSRHKVDSARAKYRYSRKCKGVG